MTRVVIPARTSLVYVESRGWLLAKLGIAVLVIAGAILVWGPLVAGRPQVMRLVGWLAWAAICSLTWTIASLPAIPTKLRATGPSPRLMSRRPRGDST